MSDNLELFNVDSDEAGKLLDRFDSIPAEELKNKWPQTLADLLDALEAELRRQKIGNSAIVASKLTAVISNYFGGRAVYIPNGDSVNAALRDYDIFINWHGNIDELIDKYGLTQSHIYSILRQQMQLHRRRHQIDLNLEDN